MLSNLLLVLLGAALFIGLPFAAVILRKMLRQTCSAERSGALKAGIWGAWLTWGSVLGAVTAAFCPDNAFYLWPLPIVIVLALQFCKSNKCQ